MEPRWSRCQDREPRRPAELAPQRRRPVPPGTDPGVSLLRARRRLARFVRGAALALLRRRDGRLRVPVVRRRDGHDAGAGEYGAGRVRRRRRRAAATGGTGELVRREPPLVACVDCGRSCRSWSKFPRCWSCGRRARARARAGAGGLRLALRERNGRCVVCGLNPCGCEFGPRVDASTGGGVDSVTGQ